MASNAQEKIYALTSVPRLAVLRSDPFSLIVNAAGLASWSGWFNRALAAAATLEVYLIACIKRKIRDLSGDISVKLDRENLSEYGNRSDRRGPGSLLPARLPRQFFQTKPV